MSSGFVAGTLVHTDKGLIPIQNLQVGDMVLSKNLSAKNNPSYKIVTNTFVSANQEIYGFLVFAKVSVQEEIYQKEMILTTFGNLFWSNKPYSEKEDFEWNNVKSLVSGDSLYSHKYEQIGVYENIILYKSKTDDLVFYMVERDVDEGFFINLNDYGNHDLKIPLYVDIDFESQPNWDENEDCIEDVFLTKVYFIEVEDYHTYFVGNLGVLVGDSTIQGTSE